VLNDIVSGINTAISSEFGADYQINPTQVRQGLQRPCFIVDFVSQQEEHFPSNRERRFNLFSVRYIPRNIPNAKLECYGVQDRLYDALAYIMVNGDLFRGIEMHGQMVDGELIFLVNYDYNNMHLNDAPFMETLDHTTIING